MSHIRNPFAKSTALAGHGEVIVSRLPPSNQALTQFTYQYPLKLITPDPHKVIVPPVGDRDGSAKEVAVTTIFLLTYGGGLLAQDSIRLTLSLEPYTRVALLTQGSTKIFKSARDTGANRIQTATLDSPTSQTLDVKLATHSSLCYLPDPNQPFADSIYVQRQTFYVDPAGSSSLLLLDWVSEGRKARGESWTLSSWRGRNEVREMSGSAGSNSDTSKGRLLIRDALILENGLDGKDSNLAGQDLSTKTNGLGVLGTLIVYGPMWKKLATFLMAEFQGLPRIGAKSWGGRATEGEKEDAARTAKQQADGLLWTAAQVRGFVLLKFGARDLDAARRWLCELLRREGSVEREFGHQALLCLK